MKFNSVQELDTLPKEEFDKLTPEQIRSMNSKPDEDLDDQYEDEQDDSDESSDDLEDDSQESDEEGQEDDGEEESEHEDSEEDEGEGADAEGADQTNAEVIKDEPAKKKSKTKSSSQAADESEVDHKGFYDTVTSTFKAAGVDLQITNPAEVVALMQKGADYTKKMQAVSHLKGIDEVLRENDLLDPTALGYLIDLKNHKPEAVARLLKESGIDPFDLAEDASDKYKATPVDFQAKARVVNVREVVEAHSADPVFNEVFTAVREWDDISQQAIVDDPELLVQLTAHKKDGTYDQVIAELQRQDLLGKGSKEPLLQRYVSTGHQMFGNPQGGSSAQAPHKGSNQQVTNAPRVVVRSNSDRTRNRKAVAAPSGGSGRRTPSKLTIADINSMDLADLDKLSPELLRKLK